jgi:hypothetical protein
MLCFKNRPIVTDVKNHVETVECLHVLTTVRVIIVIEYNSHILAFTGGSAIIVHIDHLIDGISNHRIIFFQGACYWSFNPLDKNSASAAVE